MASETSKTSGELSNTEINALKSATKLSEQEIREFHSQFKSECPSGTLSKEQFSTFYQKFMASDDKDGNLCENMFNVLDKNHDGTVDFSEFVLSVLVKDNDDLDSKLELSFQMLDTSRDEQISYEEVVDFWTKMIKLAPSGSGADPDPKVMASSVYERFGVDQGQKLSKKQFLEGCKNNPDLKKAFGGD